MRKLTKPKIAILVSLCAVIICYLVMPFVVYLIGCFIADPLGLTEGLSGYEVLAGWKSALALPNFKGAFLAMLLLSVISAALIISRVIAARKYQQKGALKGFGPPKAGHSEHGSAALIEGSSALKDVSDTWRV